MIYPTKVNKIIKDWETDSFEIVEKYETIDGMWGITHIAITDDDIKALKEGKCLYNNDGEYAQIISYKEEKCDDFSYSIDEIFAEIEKFARLQMEHKEQTLAEIITKYDFIVGSKECKHKLMEILPEEANIICSPYVANPTMIYAIKKFDIMDLVKYEE